MYLTWFINVVKKVVIVLGVLGAVLTLCQIGRIDHGISDDFVDFLLGMIGMAVAVLSYFMYLWIDVYFGMSEMVYHDMYIWFDVMHKQDRDTIWAQLDANERHHWNRELRAEITRRRRISYFRNECGIEPKSITYIYRYDNDN